MSVTPALLLATAVLSYLIGSIPFAYLIVRLVTGEDIAEHGTGNVGAMNVRRTTGSWAWFTVAMVLDALKGFAPVVLAKFATGMPMLAWTQILSSASAATAYSSGVLTLAFLMPQVAAFGAVMGHNYSFWLALKNRRFGRTGKGLATGGGALLAYDWRYFLIVVAVGLLTIAVTRYMMAGQVAAAIALPISAIVLGSADWPFCLLMGLIVYGAHHKRFVGLLQGKEPKLYVEDGAGPRG